MISSQTLQQAVAWVLTYAVHSTLLLLAAWLITRWLPAERLRWRERVWKTALLGGLFSASLQLGLELSPAAGRLEWTGLASVTQLDAPRAGEPGVLQSASGWQAAGLELSWERLLVGLWLLGGLVGVVLFLFAWRRICDRLTGREPVKQGPAFESLQRLAQGAGLMRAPRLCVSRHLRSPATVGVFLPQICVPRRALTELPPEQQAALVAHELAHILRRDPMWFFVCGLIERVLFFQPLNRVARRELQEVAEFLSDDWAAQATGDEVSLARCLTEVATWVLDLRPQVALVPMASRNSRLASRIGRLLDDGRRRQDHAARLRGPLVGLLSISACALILPGAASVDPTDQLTGTLVRPTAAPAADRTSPSAPAPADAPQNELDQLLAILDAEVEGLAADVVGLDAELADRGREDLALELMQRVQRLRERRERLHGLLPALRGELSTPPDPQPSTTPTSRNPEQEESR